MKSSYFRRGARLALLTFASITSTAPMLAMGAPAPGAYSDDGDRRFRFIVTDLERGEVLDVNDNSVGHAGLGVGTGFGCLSGTA